MKDPLEERSGDLEEINSPRTALVGFVILAAVVALFVLRPGARIPLTIVAGIIGMVMLHELGHFYTARRAGMKATEFFVGFGPRIWSFRRGETEYGVKAIPAGGYVRIIGMHNLEEVDPADENRTFRSKPFRSRFVVLVAGVTMNLILALVLFVVAFAGAGRAVDVTTTVSTVGADTPAEVAGIEPGDRLLAVGDDPIESWEELPRALEGRVDEPTPVVVARDGREITLAAVPVARGDDDSVGCLGISPEIEHERLGIGAAGREAGVTMVTASRDTAVAIGRFFSPSNLADLFGDIGDEPAQGGACVAGVPDRPMGIVGIIAVGSDIAGENLWSLLFLLAAINLILALFNMLPLLPFDGGHAAIAVYETINGRITRRPGYRADYRKMVPVSALVLFLLLALVVSITFLDVRDLFN